jgi:hypothetical protein
LNSSGLALVEPLSGIFDFNASRAAHRKKLQACLEESVETVMTQWIPRLSDTELFPTFGQSIIHEARAGGFDQVFINLAYPAGNVGEYCSFR